MGKVVEQTLKSSPAAPRVLVVTTSRHTRGGIASVVKGLEKEDLWQLHQCRWIETQIDRGMVLKLVYLVKSFFLFFWWVRKYDIVHFHTVPGNSTRIHLPLMRLAKRCGLKTIVHLHIGEQFAEYAEDKHFKALLAEADRVLVISHKARELVEKLYRLKSPAQVVYNACPAVRPDVYQGFSTERIILVLGILDANKAYDIILNAFSEIAHRNREWKLVFAGNGEVEQAREMAQRAGIEGQVEFRGWVSGSEKDDLFRQASVFCQASYKEGFPMSVLEAWTYGVPVVCTPAGGLADVVEDGVNALVVEPGDSNRLAEQLERMMNDEALRGRLAREAGRLSEMKFSTERIGAQLKQIYVEL